MKIIPLVFAVTVLAGPAIAATRKPIATAFTGTCTGKFVPATKGMPRCESKVAFVVVGNGRSFVTFMNGPLSLSFNGGHDRQPNLNNYYLSIDSIRFFKGSTKLSEDLNMEGECHMTLNDDGSEFYTVHCDAFDRRKGQGYFFHLDNIRATKTAKMP